MMDRPSTPCRGPETGQVQGKGCRGKEHRIDRKEAMTLGLDKTWVPSLHIHSTAPDSLTETPNPVYMQNRGKRPGSCIR
jgi:hypothetical protein